MEPLPVRLEYVLELVYGQERLDKLNFLQLAWYLEVTLPVRV